MTYDEIRKIRETKWAEKLVILADSGSFWWSRGNTTTRWSPTMQELFLIASEVLNESTKP